MILYNIIQENKNISMKTEVLTLKNRCFLFAKWLQYASVDETWRYQAYTFRGKNDYDITKTANFGQIFSDITHFYP